MEKYKVCPVCGAKNNPLFLECVDCEADLQNVPVVDEQTEKNIVESSGLQDGYPAQKMIRLCDCGEKNPVQARKCSACGEDISIIMPIADIEDNHPKYILSSLDGSYAFDIPNGKTVIGRENEMREYLLAKGYVSRKHAELHLDVEQGQLTIVNCNTSNYTFVNNKMLSGDEKVVLNDGDEVGLGGNEQNGDRQSQAAYFIVRINSCM